MELNRKLVNSWIEKSKKEEDVFNKFISLWIAFNAFYFIKIKSKSKISERKQVKDVSLSFTDCFIPKEIEKFYEFVQKKNPNGKVVLNMKDKSVEKSVKWNDKSSFEQYLEIVYQIRCNLFHGGKIPEVENDIILVGFAYETLFEIFNRILEKENKI